LKYAHSKHWLLAVLLSLGSLYSNIYYWRQPSNRSWYLLFALAANYSRKYEFVGLCLGSVFSMNQTLMLDCLWMRLCLLGIVYFMFRGA
jgi:uncharacterized protein (DUF486 family)